MDNFSITDYLNGLAPWQTSILGMASDDICRDYFNNVIKPFNKSCYPLLTQAYDKAAEAFGFTGWQQVKDTGWKSPRYLRANECKEYARECTAPIYDRMNEAWDEMTDLMLNYRYAVHRELERMVRIVYGDAPHNLHLQHEAVRLVQMYLDKVVTLDDGRVIYGWLGSDPHPQGTFLYRYRVTLQKGSFDYAHIIPVSGTEDKYAQWLYTDTRLDFPDGRPFGIRSMQARLLAEDDKR